LANCVSPLICCLTLFCWLLGPGWCSSSAC
jgi:hypothetical protein